MMRFLRNQTPFWAYETNIDRLNKNNVSTRDIVGAHTKSVVVKMRSKHLSYKDDADLTYRLTAIRVDPEGSSLDHFPGINLRDCRLHFIHKSPTC